MQYIFLERSSRKWRPSCLGITMFDLALQHVCINHQIKWFKYNRIITSLCILLNYEKNVSTTILNEAYITQMNSTIMRFNDSSHKVKGPEKRNVRSRCDVACFCKVFVKLALGYYRHFGLQTKLGRVMVSIFYKAVVETKHRAGLDPIQNFSHSHTLYRWVSARKT